GVDAVHAGAVAAVSALHRVATAVLREHEVLPVAGRDRVGAGAAVDAVVPRAAVQPVVPVAAFDPVVSGAAVDAVVPVHSAQPVVPRAADEAIAARPSVEQVAAARSV